MLCKKFVYMTNQKAPEKDLFAYESLVQTVRFVPLRVFMDEDEDVALTR